MGFRYFLVLVTILHVLFIYVHNRDIVCSGACAFFLLHLHSGVGLLLVGLSLHLSFASIKQT